MKNKHYFDINLMEDHCHPNNSIRMDGKEISARSLVVRAGTDGYTNVVIGLDTVLTMSFIGELTARLTENAGMDIVLSECLHKAMNRFGQETHESLSLSRFTDSEKGAMVRMLIEELIAAG